MNIKPKFNESFKAFVEECAEKNLFVGTGCPNAKILIIGKEAAIDRNDLEKKGNEWYTKNTENWQSHILNNTMETLEYDVKKEDKLYKSWGKNTWSKYQFLYNYFKFGDFRKKEKKVNFLNEIFTTELNPSVSLKTASANKKDIRIRLSLFAESEFIKQFKVIILACSDYIENTETNREIDNNFGVTYDGDETGKFVFSKTNWFFTHHNADRSKLVIHTRQLSTNVKDNLLIKMAEVINQHLSIIQVEKIICKDK